MITHLIRLAIFPIILQSTLVCCALAQDTKHTTYEQINQNHHKTRVSGKNELKNILNEKAYENQRIWANYSLHSGQGYEEITKLFGDPTSKSYSKSSLTETWHYGESSIFLQHQKIMAWSDRGELTIRKKTNTQNTTAENSSFPSAGWNNAWQKSKNIKRSDVINELIKK